MLLDVGITGHVADESQQAARETSALRVVRDPDHVLAVGSISKENSFKMSNQVDHARKSMQAGGRLGGDAALPDLDDIEGGEEMSFENPLTDGRAEGEADGEAGK